jgi:hypothetical protein
MRYDCGNSACVIRSQPGKDFERIISYAMDTLKNVFDLAAVQTVGISYPPGPSSSSPLRSAGLAAFLGSRQSVESKPFDQALLEASWSALEGVLQYFSEAEKLLFRMWIRPTEPTLAEMAFCRVVDGWKFYMEELSGKRYGEHKAILQGEEIKLDEILNETRNLFVHYGGVLGFNKRKNKKHADIFSAQLASISSSTSRLMDICHHAMGLADGSRFELGMQETVNYLYEISLLLEKIERRRSPSDDAANA